MHAVLALNGIRPLHLVREERVSLGLIPTTYESEGSERVSRGSVTLVSGGRWMATLEVRIGQAQGALLTATRSGPGADLAPTDASLLIPPGEVDAFLMLLTGLMKQAREDGVLDSGPVVKRRRVAKPRTSAPEG